MNLVLFDLDNTLLAGDSDFAWAQFLIGKGVLDREVQEAKNVQFYEQYKAGTLDIFEFLDFQLAPLARHPRAQLDAWHREFMDLSVRPMITAKARALVQQHLDSGALVAVVTATNAFVTGPIVREFGIPHLVATIPAQEGGVFTGKPVLAECGGLMSLLDSIVDKAGVVHAGAGLLPGRALMQARLVALGMQHVDLAQGRLSGHSFHYSRMETPLLPCLRAQRPDGGEGEAVYRVGSITASYVHFWFPSNPAAVAALLGAAGEMTCGKMEGWCTCNPSS